MDLAIFKKCAELFEIRKDLRRLVLPQTSRQLELLLNDLDDMAEDVDARRNILNMLK